MAQFEPKGLQSNIHIARTRVGQPTLLIIEDNTASQLRLESLLRTVCETGRILLAGTVAEANRMLQSETPDIALVDLFLPDGSGIEIIRTLRQQDPLTTAIVTTIYDDDAHLLPALAAGALGYLLKDQPDEVLEAQLRLAVEGVPPLAPEVAHKLLRYFAAGDLHGFTSVAAVETDDDEDRIGLTRRERVVLSLIAKGMQIAEAARVLNISTHTVCSHIRSIYRKRHLTCRAEAALEAQRLGLI